MSKATKLLLSIAFTAYPLLMYFSLQKFSIKYVAAGLIVLFLIRAVFIKNKDIVVYTGIAVGVILATLTFYEQDMLYVQLYPVFISFLLAVMFFLSIKYPPTIIERIARKTDSDFTEQAIPYTVKVTYVWFLFFIINGAMAAYTVFFCDIKIWTLYNGIISYCLVGFVFLIEFIVRYFVKKQYAND